MGGGEEGKGKANPAGAQGSFLEAPQTMHHA